MNIGTKCDLLKYIYVSNYMWCISCFCRSVCAYIYIVTSCLLHLLVKCIKTSYVIYPVTTEFHSRWRVDPTQMAFLLGRTSRVFSRLVYYVYWKIYSKKHLQGSFLWESYRLSEPISYPLPTKKRECAQSRKLRKKKCWQSKRCSSEIFEVLYSCQDTNLISTGTCEILLAKKLLVRMESLSRDLSSYLCKKYSSSSSRTSVFFF